MFAKLAVLAALAGPAAAHLSMWHPSMYGFDNDYSAYPMGYPDFVPFDQWWFHGNLNQPPADGQFFDLPAGGVAHAEVACNKRWTSFGGQTSPAENACPDGFGSLHEAGPENTKGCAIAIAYKSDVNTIQPEDFVVISSNHACPWNVNVDFEIPAGLPECPEGGCHCMWGWIHGQDRGGDEMYMTGFKCKVSNPGNKVLAPAKKPVRCADGDCSGAKQPLFFSKVERANVERGDEPPYYNDAYGYTNGAQNDIFTGAQGPAPTKNTSTPTKATQTHNVPAQTDNTAAESQTDQPQPTTTSQGDDQCDDETTATSTTSSRGPRRTGGHKWGHNGWNKNGDNNGWNKNGDNNGWNNGNNDRNNGNNDNNDWNNGDNNDWSNDNNDWSNDDNNDENNGDNNDWNNDNASWWKKRNIRFAREY